MLNEDYRDMLQSLADENVKFILVGAYAMAAHGYPRATKEEADGLLNGRAALSPELPLCSPHHVAENIV